jgi:DNA ligase-associated metallophosphoesterase
MTQATLFNWKEQHLWLHPDRTIYWEEKKALILSDPHFGKSGHFRKSGIAVPSAVFKEDLQRLFAAIQTFQPKQLIITGDLFHSVGNAEHELFAKWRNDFLQVPFILVKGNHDILPPTWYEKNNIVLQPYLWVEPFLFLHDPQFVSQQHHSDLEKLAKELEEKTGEGLYQFIGHLHPGIVLRGQGKQQLRLPCFVFQEKQAILPAFSRFTGMATFPIQQQDRIFAATNNMLLSIQ